jgi:hypothetical protein
MSGYSSFSVSNQLSILDSDNPVVKTAFVILVIFICLVITKLVMKFLNYFFQSNDTVYLLNGMVDASKMIIYEQDPSLSGGKTIYRSVDESEGIEFTWSVWIYIEDLVNTSGQYKHIFSKGNSDLGQNGLVTPINAPGLYLAPHINTLVLIMNTFNEINEEILIPDIPLNKWVNVIIRCRNTTIDLYINGTISRSIKLLSIPRQNYGKVYVAMNNGFNGYISNLWYYNYALGTTKIQQISNNGPSTKLLGYNNNLTLNNYDYLSLRWFLHTGDAARVAR